MFSMEKTLVEKLRQMNSNMELKIGERIYTVKPYLIKKCGATENIGFRVYNDAGRMKQFDDLTSLGLWITNIIVDETFDIEPEK